MTVFVTGSSRGIGKAIAKEFNGMGYNVVINGVNNAEALAQTEREFLKNNENVLAIQADMSVYNQAEEAYKLIRRYFGGVDILINNAGVSYVGLFSEMTPEEWQRVTDININAMLNCTHLVLPCMINNKKGNIINISSMWGEHGASCEAVYSMTKGAVNSFTKSLGKELGPSGIRVNAIACGVIDTEMNSFLSKSEKEALANNISLMRFGTPQEVADLAVFLSSDESKYITGQVIAIEGGYF